MVLGSYCCIFINPSLDGPFNREGCPGIEYELSYRRRVVRVRIPLQEKPPLVFEVLGSRGSNPNVRGDIPPDNRDTGVMFLYLLISVHRVSESAGMNFLNLYHDPIDRGGDAYNPAAALKNTEM